MLRVYDEKSTQLITAALHNDELEVERLLIMDGININYMEERGLVGEVHRASALVYALMKGHSDIAGDLLANGANVNLPTRNDLCFPGKCLTPLAVAAYHRKIDDDTFKMVLRKSNDLVSGLKDDSLLIELCTNEKENMLLCEAILRNDQRAINSVYEAECDGAFTVSSFKKYLADIELSPQQKEQAVEGLQLLVSMGEISQRDCNQMKRMLGVEIVFQPVASQVVLQQKMAVMEAEMAQLRANVQQVTQFAVQQKERLDYTLAVLASKGISVEANEVKGERPRFFGQVRQ